jgi:transcriptional regulator with XRE-family HTH domain
MSLVLPVATHDGALLSTALKSVRKHRGLSTTEVAGAMNMPLRTYERFEAGETRLNLDHIHRFATATRSDAHAILLAVAAGSPELARRCADNQLGTILLIALQRFDLTMGDTIQTLEAREVIAAVMGMFESLGATKSRSDTAADWIAQGARDLKSRRPAPGR